MLPVTPNYCNTIPVRHVGIVPWYGHVYNMYWYECLGLSSGTTRTTTAIDWSDSTELYTCVPRYELRNCG